MHRQVGPMTRSVVALWRRPSDATRRQLATSNGANANRLAPMMVQYLARKKEYPDCVLLFQVGDFYEMFGTDARRVSPLLNLALAKRSKQASDLEIMCGFPLGALNSYLEKLVMHHGLKVAICNQVESPQEAKKRGGTGAIVNRQVVRVATPGSLVEDTMLKPEENNFLASVCVARGSVSSSSSSSSSSLSDQAGVELEAAVTWTDLSTGEFLTTHCASVDKLQSVLLRCAPKEVLLDPDLEQNEDLMGVLEEALPVTCMKTFRSSSNGFNCSPTMAQHLAQMSPLEQQAASAILEYVDFTQKHFAHDRDGSRSSAMIKPPRHIDANDHMIIDPSAWKSLEITRTLGGSKSLSLLASIDRTLTASGSRLLATQLANPLMNLELLNDRLDAVEFLVQTHPQGILKSFRNGLNEIADVERSLQRLSLSAGTPRDLKNIATTVQEANQLVNSLRTRLQQLQLTMTLSKPIPKLLAKALESLESSEPLQQLAQTIQNALEDDVTRLNSFKGFVKPGFAKELDEWREILHFSSPISSSSLYSSNESVEDSLVNHSSKRLLQLQEKYRQRLGSKRLRVNHQKERGFFIELPHEESHLVLQQSESMRTSSSAIGDDHEVSIHDWKFFHSTKRVVRYRTKELDQMHFKLLHAQQQVDFLEKQVFDDLKRQVCDPSMTESLQQLGSWLAQCDVFCSHAQVAVMRKYTRPLLDWSFDLHIEQGRHAIVEAAQDFTSSTSTRMTRLGGTSFVPNSLHLGRSQLASSWLLTGPNMGGKSTFLRQNAHLVILSQIGSFVPARFAKLGLVDRVFSRVGSSDELAKHRSTFLVEMQETSTILKQATSRSFVLMDEIGRGTSVQDGMAIAAAVLEEICARQTRCLFATHFTQLADWFHDCQALQCQQMEILQLPAGSRAMTSPSRKPRKLVFSYRVVPGIASCSYGINTAALAGCPPRVLERAQTWLHKFAKEQQNAQTSSESSGRCCD